MPTQMLLAVSTLSPAGVKLPALLDLQVPSMSVASAKDFTSAPGAAPLQVFGPVLLECDAWPSGEL